MAIKSILNSPLFYKVFHPVLSAAAKINNHIEIQKSYRQHLEFNSYSERMQASFRHQNAFFPAPFKACITLLSRPLAVP